MKELDNHVNDPTQRGFKVADITGKVAITAIMRKLRIVANVLLRDNRTWIATAP